jgi:hypothetical protein
MSRPILFVVSIAACSSPPPPTKPPATTGSASTTSDPVATKLWDTACQNADDTGKATMTFLVECGDKTYRLTAPREGATCGLKRDGDKVAGGLCVVGDHVRAKASCTSGCMCTAGVGGCHVGE